MQSFGGFFVANLANCLKKSSEWNDTSDTPAMSPHLNIHVMSPWNIANQSKIYSQILQKNVQSYNLNSHIILIITQSKLDSLSFSVQNFKMINQLKSMS